MSNDQNIPIPGHGHPSGVKPTPNPRDNVALPADPAALKLLDAQHRDEWDIELRHSTIAGVASEESRKARELFADYEEFIADHFPVLRDDWLPRAVERESRALAEFVNAGKEPPAKRESEVDKAIKARPLALAKARKMRTDVQRADAEAKRAFQAAAPAAIPGVREAVRDALNAAEEALAAFVRATVDANRLHSQLVELDISVRKPLPTQREMMRRILLDARIGVQEAESALRDAKGRVSR